MSKASLLIVGLFLAYVGNSVAQGHRYAKRSERFFGFHFDFHATAADMELGKNKDTVLLSEFLRRTRPDFIQVDSKGHPGYSSYPTQVGYSANSFLSDPLRTWRAITKAKGIPLYVHYSSIWDQKALKEHPEWGRKNADGTTDSTKVSLESDYVRELMIPQLKELIDEYAIDGVWIDGDCWSTGLDYSTKNTQAFLAETRLAAVPRKPSDRGYRRWLNHNRQAYHAYLKAYVDTLHRHAPGFQVASNWAYSSMMPVPVDTQVDFLSGDVSAGNCVYNSAFQARCLALQGRPWDLMAWSFFPIDFMGGIHSPKSLVQLQQEAAQVIAMGGGFQVYLQQNRDASFRKTDTEAMARLAAYCRQRQPFCQDAEIVPQVGIWYSLKGWQEKNNGVYGWSSHLEGITSLLLDNRYSVEILMDHQLDKKMEQYALIVVPEWEQFDEKLLERLKKYVKSGGRLLIIGAAASQTFASWLPVQFEGRDSLMLLNAGSEKAGGITGLKTRWQKVLSKDSSEREGLIYAQSDFRYSTHYPVATVHQLGKGALAAVYLDLSSAYRQYKSPILNRLVSCVVDRMLPKRDLKVEGSEKVHVVWSKKRKAQLVHLVNVGGDHANKTVMRYEELPATPPLEVSLRLSSAPRSVRLQPEGKPLPFRYEKGYVRINVPPVSVHAIVEVHPYQ
ncbi:alpha-L-fucosidase [Larkinella harenae]